jgi:hypothetical protein
MKDYDEIRRVWEENSEVSGKLIDEFLIYYAGGRNNLEYKMNQAFASYKHVTKDLKKEWINRLKAQYIAHRIFKKDGLIKSLMEHPPIKDLENKSREYLEF